MFNGVIAVPVLCGAFQWISNLRHFSATALLLPRVPQRASLILVPFSIVEDRLLDVLPPWGVLLSGVLVIGGFLSASSGALFCAAILVGNFLWQRASSRGLAGIFKLL